MKKYLSVFMIYVRSSIYKASALFAAMAAVQLVLYEVYATKRFENLKKFAGVEELLQQSGLFVVFGVAFVLLTLILCYNGSEFSGKQGYTLRRLRISERSVFLLQSSANALFYTLFWLCEIVIIRALMAIYLKSVPEEIYTDQMLMLSFYRNDYIGQIMPLSNLTILVRNIIWVLAMAVTSAFFPYMQRRRRIGFSVIIMTAIVIASAMADGDVSVQALPIVWAVLIIFAVLWRVMRGECDEKEA